MKHAVAVLFAASLMAVTSGCATHSGARLDRSKEVLDNFRSFTVLPGYRYYTSGPGNTPDAILGIASGYTLKSEVWKETKMTPDLLKRHVLQMNNLFSAEETGLIGASVLNDMGEQVGIWYSAVGLTTVDVLSATGFPCGANDRHCGAESAGRQRPGVAMGDQRTARCDRETAMKADAAITFLVLRMNRARLVQRCLERVLIRRRQPRCHPVEAPRQIDRSRPSPAQNFQQGFELHSPVARLARKRFPHC